MCNRQYIEKLVYEILDEANIVEVIEENTYIINNNIDSIQLISIIVEIEERFNIEISDEYLIVDFLSDFSHIVDSVEEMITSQCKMADISQK